MYGGTGATNGSDALTNLGVTPFAKTILDDTNDIAVQNTLGLRRYRFTANKAGASQVIVPSTNTKVSFTTQGYDEGDIYDPVLSRCTPKLAGEYRFTLAFRFFGLDAGNAVFCSIWKNGSAAGGGELIQFAPAPGDQSFSITKTLGMNGTTDYVEPYVFLVAGVNKTISGAFQATWFEGQIV